MSEGDRRHIVKEINSTVLLSMDKSSRQASDASPVRPLVPNLDTVIIYFKLTSDSDYVPYM
jgi:hypothetical protein